MSSVPLEQQSAPNPWLDFWPRFLLFPALAIVLYPLFILGWGGNAWWVTAGWVVLLAYCWFCIGGSFHEAAHQTLFRSQRWNVGIGRVLGTLIGIPYTAYRETHRRHHAYLNTPDDYELWPYSDPRTSLLFRRIFVWIDVFLGVVTSPIIYSRIYWKRDARLGPEVRKSITFEYALMAVSWMVGLGLLIALAVATRFEWHEFRIVWLLPLILSPMANTIRKFVEHLGMTSTDPLLGTRTVAFGNPFTRLLSYFNFDIAVHGPHHRHPRVQHYELTPKLVEFQESHPDSSTPVFRSYRAAVVDMLPCLWRNPATGDHRRQAPAVTTTTESIGWESKVDATTE